MKKLVVALAVVLCFYGGFVIWSINEYNTYYNNGLQSYKKIGFEKYYDPIPFMGFWYGKTTFALGVLLALICGSLLYWKLNAKILKIFIIFISLALFTSIFVSTTQAVEPITVNALLFFDEECTDPTQRENVYHDFFYLEPLFPI